MRTAIISLLAATTVAAGVPAVSMAQNYGYDRSYDRYDNYVGGGQWQNINARQQRLDRRIDRALRDGRISMREARSLRAEFIAIARLEQRYRATGPGLTMRERADLDRRFDMLSSRIRVEATDGNRYGYGYGPLY